MNEFLGTIQKYRVLRQTNLGYVLTYDGTDEYFLHRNETNFQTLNVDQTIDAFLYADKIGRFALTLYKPTVTTTKIGFARVQDVSPTVGIFVNIGTSKDILLSRDDLPLEQSEWPKCGDYVVGRLKVKAEKLVLKMATKDEILEASKKEELPLNEKVKAFIYRMTKDGVNLVTENLNIVFVYHANMRKKYRLGEEAFVKILAKNENDYTGTLIEHKEVIILSDRETLLQYLKAHDGVMAITEKSDSEVIKHVFQMSKKAFKAAIGNLYKDRLIEIHDDKIILL
ncbi:MAG: S1-like domain-containing RNA-binding protein [Bacilli bacterium]|jgi:predicted RNA-binding protein (virulence factor B family)|nr:S1-like domain-containing RNA-binding protein [Bacilli bacterium]